MDKKLIEDAYRKLKGSVYLDKTVPYLRMRISDFERGDLEQKIKNIYNALYNEEKWLEFEQNILDSINALTFPQKLKCEDEAKEEPIVISNVCDNEVVIEKYNNFIDMSVEGHIVGVLWILTIGYKMDDNLYINCYGNRLNKNLLYSKSKTTASPNLFKPYFSQYESWRNQGLKIADNVVNDRNNSVVITMLDLTRYYYNVAITEEKYNIMTTAYFKSDDQVLKRLNKCIYNIIKTFSDMCNYKRGSMLPIGFLPSNILSNYYLKDLDEEMSKLKGTAYYGRYVDDMILVTELGEETNFNDNILNRGNKYACEYILNLLEKSEVLCKKGNDKYSINNFPELDFQKNKFRFFYIDKNGYDTIIEKIHHDICQNASEFNYIPETAIEELNTDILKIEREDTVNKLRAINSTSIDKYVLSKTVGKNIMMSKFAEEKTISKFARNLEQVLNHKEILNNYTMWESILNYYVINNYFVGIRNLSQAVCSAIEHMDEDKNKCNEFQCLSDEKIDTVGDSLKYFYLACLTRATAISWGPEIMQMLDESKTILLNIGKYSKYNYLYSLECINQKRKAYCNSRMINKNLLPVTIDDCMSAFKPSDANGRENLFSLRHYLQSEMECRFDKSNKKFAPYIQSPFDILYSVLVNQIRNGEEQLLSDQECVNILVSKYAENFGNVNGKYIGANISVDSFGDKGNIIKVKTNKHYANRSVRIAVANVKMNESDIDNIFSANVRDLSERCKEIGKILNEAIRNKSDYLIFPEAYIPLEYLHILQAKAANNNMVIIGGIEHIKNKNIVYNLTVTIVPIKNKYMSYAIPFFHQKKYFSPHELEIVSKYKCKPAKGQKHTLFEWGKIFFATYCCYELTSINLRHSFQGLADIIFGVEWNKDTYYFGNIMESLSRDIYCYCAQANMSEYGDSRIIQPTKKDFMNILRVKGGINASVLIGEIDIKDLRKHQKGRYSVNGKDIFKPLPAGWDLNKVNMKK